MFTGKYTLDLSFNTYAMWLARPVGNRETSPMGLVLLLSQFIYFGIQFIISYLLT